MNAQQIQTASQLLNPLFALVLFGYAVHQLRKRAFLWIFCVALSVGLAQQISKIAQHFRWISEDFPSTHFAVALALAGAFVALNRRSWPWVGAFVSLYGALILWRGWHSPLDLLGAFYAVPLGWGGARFASGFGTRRRRIASD